MYQVIARKYRPQTFADVVNQDHVKQTLSNALTQGRVGHGYIFSGQRGTGKTTMARILAKCLNCDKGPTAEPCLACSSCTEIARGNSMDLTEIDAASNRRIDDIRELRENVRYRPVRDRYKVFIIDEAHQITSDAFNALLKTLEEPPEWVVFVLCTTEPHEIPATIVSRCQGFQFRAVEFEPVVAHMQRICEKEGVEADEDALISIALSGDGSIRDALSTLDQAIACFGNRLESKPVRDLLGAIPTEVTDHIVSALQSSDASAMLDTVEQVLREGRNVQHFCGELVRYFRNLLVLKVSGEDTRLVSAGPDERKALIGHAAAFSQEDLTRYVHIILDLYRDLQSSPQPRFRFEIGLLKLVYAGHIQNIEKVLAGLGGGGGGSTSGKPSTGSGSSGKSASVGSARATAPRATAPLVQESRPQAAPDPPARTTAPAPSAAVTQAAAEAANGLPEGESGSQSSSELPVPEPRASDSPASDLRAALLAALLNDQVDHLADAIEHGTVELIAGEVVVRSSPDYRTSLELDMASLEEALAKLLSKNVRVRLGDNLAADEIQQAVARDVPVPAGGPHSSSDSEAGETKERALADPAVRMVQETFQGNVREVRNLRGYSS
ncbi:MAG: DNA polymerase III subunit gamma/tau [Acidobacteria bacterium]|nr:DNA polymerase III subunit gamma/tau [Acidobacteriota bacterium]